MRASDHTLAPTSPPTGVARPASMSRQIFGLMLAAYVLSVVHTVVSDLTGIAPDGFTLADPMPYVVYALGFAVAVLARQERLGAQNVVLGWLVMQLLVGVLVYPQDFGPRQQTVFGWVENGAFLGLLTAALHLAVQRRRGVILVPNLERSPV